MLHLTPDGPRECEATVGVCRYKDSSAHFENLSEAEAAYAKRFDTSALKKTYAPPKSKRTAYTQDDVEGFLEKLREENPRIALLKGKLVSFSPFGSTLYNLDHPDSDEDLLIITDAKSKVSFQSDKRDERDIRVSSVYDFMDEYKRALHFNVDVLHSPFFQKAAATPWSAFMSQSRFSGYEYMTRLQSLSRRFAEDAQKHANPMRENKYLKTSLRNEILVRRFQCEGVVRPVFTDSEREDFYRVFKKISNQPLPKDNPYDLVFQSAKEVS